MILSKKQTETSKWFVEELFAIPAGLDMKLWMPFIFNLKQYKQTSDFVCVLFLKSAGNCFFIEKFFFPPRLVLNSFSLLLKSTCTPKPRNLKARL